MPDGYINFLIIMPSPTEKSLDADTDLAGGFVNIGPGLSLFAAHEERPIPINKAAAER
jgi:hypothetical protein